MFYLRNFPVSSNEKESNRQILITNPWISWICEFSFTVGSLNRNNYWTASERILAVSVLLKKGSSCVEAENRFNFKGDLGSLSIAKKSTRLCLKLNFFSASAQVHHIYHWDCCHRYSYKEGHVAGYQVLYNSKLGVPVRVVESVQFETHFVGLLCNWAI